MVLDSVKVNVNCKVTISEDTVERCLMLIEMYLNDNPGKTIRQNKTETDDGWSVSLNVEDEEMFR